MSTLIRYTRAFKISSQRFKKTDLGL